MLSSIIPNTRIMSWGYDANTHSTKELSAMYLYNHIQNLVSDLSLYRRSDKVGNPIKLLTLRLRAANNYNRRIYGPLFSLPTVSGG